MTRYQQLTQDERYRITALRQTGCSQAEIARQLGRSASTISRELRRNFTRHDGFYRAEKAQKYALARRRRARKRTRFTDWQWLQVNRLIRQKWSPQQIVGTLPWRISHETIYLHVLKNKKAGGTLYKHLRIMSKKVRKRYNSKDSRGVLRGKRHISERPAIVEKRERIGDWEGDTVIGQDKRHCVLTLVERRSGFVIIKKLRSRTAAEVTAAGLRAIAEHVGQFRTLTFDNGTEFHDYKTLEKHSGVTCYFATPYHSWERGSNENLNGLFRQYVPKGSCMKGLTQRRCDEIAHELNTRPRARHGFKTPLEVYYAS